MYCNRLLITTSDNFAMTKYRKQPASRDRSNNYHLTARVPRINHLMEQKTFTYCSHVLNLISSSNLFKIYLQSHTYLLAIIILVVR